MLPNKRWIKFLLEVIACVMKLIDYSLHWLCADHHIDLHKQIQHFEFFSITEKILLNKKFIIQKMYFFFILIIISLFYLKFLRKKFWLGLESNSGPHACQSAALTIRPHGPFFLKNYILYYLLIWQVPEWTTNWDSEVKAVWWDDGHRHWSLE